MPSSSAQYSKATQANYDLTNVFVHGAMRMLNAQAAAARVLLQAQARSARIFGAPDWSLPVAGSTEQMSQWVSASTEQAFGLARHTGEIFGEVQQQIGRLMERQAAEFAQEMQRGLEEVNRRAEAGLDEFRDAGKRAVTAAAREVSGSHGQTTAGSEGARKGRKRRSR